VTAHKPPCEGLSSPKTGIGADLENNLIKELRSSSVRLKLPKVPQRARVSFRRLRPCR